MQICTFRRNIEHISAFFFWTSQPIPQIGWKIGVGKSQRDFEILQSKTIQKN